MMDGFGEGYENPLEFDPYRFLKMRSTPGKVSKLTSINSQQETGIDTHWKPRS